VIFQVAMKDAERRRREYLEMSTAISTSRYRIRSQTMKTRMSLPIFEICDYIQRQMGVHKSSYILRRICLKKTNTKAPCTQILQKVQHRMNTQILTT